MAVPARPSLRRPSALVLALLLALTGCSGSVDRDDIRSAGGRLVGIDVTGTPGERPRVRIAAPLEVPSTRSDVLVEGTGGPVVIDQLFVLQLTLYDARTGEQAISTYDRGQRALAVKNTDATLFPALSDALVGVRQGGRLVMALAAEDGYGAAGAPQYGIEPGDALVVVADVVAVPPTTSLAEADGEPVTGGDRFVRVLPEDGPPARVRLLRAEPPADLRVQYLRRGGGPPVRADSLITLHSLAQVWGAREPFDDSFAKEPALVPIGTGSVVRAWDRALVGVPLGSRVAIVAPPRFAFGSAGKAPDVPPGATIVYVVDVLGVS